MKIILSQLKRIVKEELENALEEKKGEGAIIHRDEDELIPADHWTVKKGKCKPGETVRKCMRKLYTEEDEKS